MFVAMSKFEVANGMTDQVYDAFVNRPHLVDTAPGFVRMEVLRPREAPNEFWLLTFWHNEGSFRNWHRSHTYHNAHSGIPKGLN